MFQEARTVSISNMTSPPPLHCDTYYHIYNRGARLRRENIFFEERNYDLFMRLYEKHLAPVTDLLAYCLLRNHFHFGLMVKSEEEILETKKTLRVYSANRKLIRPSDSPNHNEAGKKTLRVSLCQ
jgi:hypothetical protein